MHVQLINLCLELEFSIFFILHVRLVLFSIFLSRSQIMVGSSQSLSFGGDFLLELINRVLSDSELSFKFIDLILCFNQVFGVEVALRPDSFIQILLSLQL